MWSDGTAWRFWLGSKNRAIGAPAASVTVVVSGSGPSTTSVEAVVTAVARVVRNQAQPDDGGEHDARGQHASDQAQTEQ